jgi:hypothetical protein
MEKLARFIIVALLFVATVILFYSFFPAIVWMFGGSFRDVAQSVPYVLFGGIMTVVAVGVTFSECFDERFYPKK